jgi:hypothetical protein
MQAPKAFREEPYRSLCIGRELFQHEVQEILSISVLELSDLRLAMYLRPLGTACNPRWNRRKVVAFAWGLRTSPRFAETVAFLIGRHPAEWASHNAIM